MGSQGVAYTPTKSYAQAAGARCLPKAVLQERPREISQTSVTTPRTPATNPAGPSTEPVRTPPAKTTSAHLESDEPRETPKSYASAASGSLKCKDRVTPWGSVPLTSPELPELSEDHFPALDATLLSSPTPSKVAPGKVLPPWQTAKSHRSAQSLDHVMTPAPGLAEETLEVQQDSQRPSERPRTTEDAGQNHDSLFKSCKEATLLDTLPSSKSPAKSVDQGSLVSQTPSLASSSAVAEDHGEGISARTRAALLRGLQHPNEMVLTDVSYDLLLVCQCHQWKLYRGELRGKCGYFGQLLPPVEPTNPRMELRVDDLDPEKLDCVIRYLQDRGWDHGLLDASDPIEGRSISINVHMYLAAQMVDCQEMMEFALCNIEDSTNILKTIIKDHTHGNIARFEEPLRLAILEMYSQCQVSNESGPLRLAIARLVDVVVLYLWLNPTFKEPLEQFWLPQIFRRLAVDNDFFCRQGLLEHQPEGWKPFDWSHPTSPVALEAKPSHHVPLRTTRGRWRYEVTRTVDFPASSREMEGHPARAGFRRYSLRRSVMSKNAKLPDRFMSRSL